MRDDFGIGLGNEFVAARLKSLLQRARVLDDAVMNDRDVALAIEMRVGVAFVGHTVSRPAGVANAELTVHRTGSQGALELGDLPGRLPGFDAATVHDGNSRRIVPAIFHALESLEEERGSAALSDITDNSAHRFFGLTVLPYRASASTGCRQSRTSFSASSALGASAITRTIGSVPEGRMCTQRSGHVSLSPSWVSTSAVGKARFRASYTVSRGAFGRSSLSLTMI